MAHSPTPLHANTQEVVNYGPLRILDLLPEIDDLHRLFHGLAYLSLLRELHRLQSACLRNVPDQLNIRRQDIPKLLLLAGVSEIARSRILEFGLLRCSVKVFPGLPRARENLADKPAVPSLSLQVFVEGPHLSAEIVKDGVDLLQGVIGVVLFRHGCNREPEVRIIWRRDIPGKCTHQLREKVEEYEDHESWNSRNAQENEEQLLSESH